MPLLGTRSSLLRLQGTSPPGRFQARHLLGRRVLLPQRNLLPPLRQLVRGLQTSFRNLHRRSCPRHRLPRCPLRLLQQHLQDLQRHQLQQQEQNRIIAQNNATIAAQNRAIALNSSRANDAYSLANRLGLAQSYAYADKEYFYQDGVFYIINSKGKYEVIVPPAGALVEELPDDYDVITLGGNDYYKVDDTVYRLTLVEGTPYLEVLGQMYGDLARQYDYNANGVSFNDIY